MSSFPLATVNSTSFANDQTENGLRAFGPDVIVECKSSVDPLNAVGISHFGRRVADRSLSWSIIVSLAGITGDREEKTAAQTVIRDFARDGAFIMVLVEDELRALRSAAHLALAIERKRQTRVLRLYAAQLTAEESAEDVPQLVRSPVGR